MNLLAITGNLGKDCRTATTQGGTAVCNFTVAVKSGYGDREQTLWIDCSLWGKQAESRLPEYLVKGAQVAVTGELGTKEHEGKTYLTCKVSSIDLVGGKREAQQQAPQQPTQQQSTGGGAMDDFSDDIPFARIGPEAF